MIYGFLLNMWILRRIDEDYINRMVEKKYITTEEKQMILTTPQM